MRKLKFDMIELNVLVSLIDRKLEKLSEKGVDEFTLDYERILKGLREKITKLSKK